MLHVPQTETENEDERDETRAIITHIHSIIPYHTIPHTPSSRHTARQPTEAPREPDAGRSGRGGGRGRRRVVFLPHRLVLVRVEPALLDRRPHPAHVLLHVLPVELRRLRVRRAVRVRVVQERLDRGQDRRDVVRRRPPVLEDVQAELPVRVHVRVEHPRQELHRRRLVRVRLVEREQQLECPVLERRVRCPCPGPKMTAFQSMMLSGHGLPEIPPGGSVESRLKSRMRRRRQLVLCIAVSIDDGDNRGQNAP
ncbi:hypothetical protein FKP32DRAFT_42608 [Trametes sanguinea]|nr:hypothetical protein FKP32DRAFT_42608 [Trametes sanguinea]